MCCVDRLNPPSGADSRLGRKMREAIAEELPDIVLDSVADFMLLASRREGSCAHEAQSHSERR